MADKRISQLVERVTLATNDVFPIVASGATTTNKVTLQTIDDYMQTNLDFGVTSVAISVPTGLSVTGTPVTSTGTFVITFTAGYSIPTTAKQTQWDTAYTNRITSATAPLGIASNVISITQSGASTDGYLSSTDWNTFNNKQSTITKGNLTEATSSVLTITGGTDAVIGSGTSIEVKQASGSQDGFLDSADWTTFNDKQNALSGTGIVKSTGGTISYLTDSTSNWDSAYNDKINSASVTGTTTKTLTLNQQDGGTITTTWTDLDTGTVTSVGVSMPSAFSVANSPITSSGTIAITGAGTISQYIDGTGALRTFPSIISQATNLVREVYNNSGATMTKGTVVYINGGQGNLPTIAKALATGDSTSAQTYGVVQNSIGNMSNGYIVVVGDLIDMDTQAFVEGTQLYLSPTTAGEYTSTKQYAPNHLVYVGIVTRSHPTQGIIAVKIQNGYEMDELHNVSAQSPNNNDILQYKTATGLWTKTAGTTSNIAEGTNLYYTDARSRAAISESVTGLDYNSSTGVLSTTTGYAIPTTASQTNWDAAYNDKINSAAVSGTTTKTLTLTQQDGGTITASWTDINTDAVSSVFGRTGAVVATSGDYNTDQVTEGSSNLYFTNARSRSSITLTTTGTSGAATYNSTTGVLNIPSYVGGVTSVNTLTGAVVLTTSNIAEGTNLYYTDTRARAAISLTTTGTSGAATYNSTTGALNIPNYAPDLTGYVTLGTAQTITGAKTFNSRITQNLDDNYIVFNRSAVNKFFGVLYQTAGTNQWFVGLREQNTNHYYIYNEVLGLDAVTINRTNNNVTFGATISATNFSGSSSGTNTGDQTLAGLGGIGAGFETYGTLYPRTAVTTYRDHSVSAANDAPIRSLSNTEDNWIYCDAANAQWGIYHRNIDTDLVVSGQPTLPGNSIAYIGANIIASYLNLSNGNAYFRGTLSASNLSGTNTGDQTLSGLGGVPTSRTLTINGTAFDLSADRSWTISGTSGVTLDTAQTITGKKTFSRAFGDNDPIIVLEGTSTASFQYVTTSYNSGITAGKNICHFIGKASANKQSGYFGYQWNGDNSNSNFITLGIYMVDHIVKIYPTREVEFTGDILGTNIYNNGILRTRGTSNQVYYNAAADNVGFGAVIGHGATANRTAFFRGQDVNNAASVWWGYVDASSRNVPTFAIDSISGGGAAFWNNTAGSGGGTWTNVARVEAGMFKINDGKLAVQSGILGDSVVQIEGNIKIGTWATSGSRYIGYTRNDDGTWGVAGASGLEMQSVNIGTGGLSQNVHIWSHTYNGGSGRRLSVRYDGNVGVNNDNPQTTFDVNGRSYIGKMQDFSPAVHIRGSYYGAPRLQIYGLDADANAHMGLGTDMDGGAYGLSLYYSDVAGSNINFGRYNGGNGTRYSGFTITAKLSHGGTFTAAGDLIAFGSPSDINYKENVKPIEDALDKILQLEGVSFDWKEGTNANKLTNIKEDLGFIAQQVQGVLPKLVRKNDDGKLSLRDKGIIPYLVEAIKEQQKQIEELKKQVA